MSKRGEPYPYNFGDIAVVLSRREVVAMCEAEDVHGGDESLLFDREDLAASIELILSGGAEGADALARLLDSFRDALDGGLRGVGAAREGLSAAVELAYLRTGAHAAALRLYRLSLEGRLRVEDEPGRLLGAAIGRRTAGAREQVSSRNAER